MKLITLLFLIASVAFAGPTTTKQIDVIHNSAGGSNLSVPSAGATFVSDTNTVSLQNKSIQGTLTILTGGSVSMTDSSNALNMSSGTINMGGGTINAAVLASGPTLGDTLDANNHDINNINQLSVGANIQMNGHTLVNLGTLNQEFQVAAPLGVGLIADFHGTDATKQNNIVIHGAGTETYLQLHNDPDASSWDFVDASGGFSLIDDLTDHTLHGIDSDLTQQHFGVWWGAATGRTGFDIQVHENANGQGNIANFSSSAGGSFSIHDNGDVTTSGTIASNATGQSSFSGQINMNSNGIVGLAAPQNPSDAATKGYVDEFDGAIPVAIVTNGNDLTGSEGSGTVAAVQPGGTQKSPPITVATVTASATYSFNIGATAYSINSGASPTATSILNALAAAVTADVSAIVTASVNGTPALVLTEKSIDSDFTLTSVTTNLSPSGTVNGVNPFIGKGGQVATKSGSVWNFNSSYAAGTLVTPNFPRIGQFFELNNDHASWVAIRTVSRLAVDKTIDASGSDGRLEMEGGPILWNGSGTAPSPGFGGDEAVIYFDSTSKLLMQKQSGGGDGGANFFPINGDHGEQSLGTLTWDGTAPSGTVNAFYMWSQEGKRVTLTVNITASVAGATNTKVSFPLPASMPTPHGFTGGSNAFIGAGEIDTGPPDLSSSFPGHCEYHGGTVTIQSSGSLAASGAFCTLSYMTD